MLSFLVENAVTALMGKVCSRGPDRTIDPWLRSLPLHLQIVPARFCGEDWLGLALIRHFPEPISP